MTREKLEKIYSHCSDNKEELLKAKRCGCFNCFKMFSPKEIEEWIKFNDSDDFTAFCPYCGIDSIIAESDEYMLNDELLKELHDTWMS